MRGVAGRCDHVVVVGAGLAGLSAALHLLERLPGGPPRGLHDPALFVDRAALVAAAERLGLDLELVGLRPSLREAVAWKFAGRATVSMKPVRWTGSVFAGIGRKRAGGVAAGAHVPSEP